MGQRYHRGFTAAEKTELRWRCKLLLSPFTFLNYAKVTKYEALEKNVVSEPKYRNSGNLKYSGNSRNAPLRLKIFGLFVNGEIKMRASLADGEELGSNLLHVHANVTESNLV
jgi:hypothetical protein